MQTQRWFFDKMRNSKAALELPKDHCLDVSIKTLQKWGQLGLPSCAFARGAGLNHIFLVRWFGTCLNSCLLQFKAMWPTNWWSRVRRGFGGANGIQQRWQCCLVVAARASTNVFGKGRNTDSVERVWQWGFIAREGWKYELIGLVAVKAKNEWFKEIFSCF